MFNLLHRKIMHDNMKWDACTSGQRWVNTILLMAIVWFLMSSTSPLFAAAGLSIAIYVVVARIWYIFVMILIRVFPSPPAEEEKEEGEHYLLMEKKKEKEKENEDK